MTPDHNPPMDCPHVLELLDDFRRDALPPDIQQQVSRHLATCDACAAELRAREALATQLRNAVPATLPAAALSPAIKRAIALQAEDSTPATPRRKPMLPWLLTAAAAVIITVAFIQIKPRDLSQHTDTVAMTTRRPAPPPAAEQDTFAAAAAGDAAQPRGEIEQLGFSSAETESAAAPPALMPPDAMQDKAPAQTAAAVADRIASGEDSLKKASLYQEPVPTATPPITPALRAGGAPQPQRLLSETTAYAPASAPIPASSPVAAASRRSSTAEQKAEPYYAPATVAKSAPAQMQLNTASTTATQTTQPLTLQTTATLEATTATTTSVAR